MAYVIAAVVAALMLLGEFRWDRRYWWTVPSTGWWTLRVLIDVSAALVVAGVLSHVQGDEFVLGPVLTGLIAGIGAPRLICRVPIPIPHVGQNLNPIGLGYQRIVRPVDQQIDEHSAEAQRRYVRQTIRPYAEAGKLPVTEIESAFKEHIQGRRGLSEAERAQKLQFIRDIVDDTNASDPDKVATLVLRAWQIGAYAALKDLLDPLPRRRYGTKPTVAKIGKRLRHPIRSRRPGEQLPDES